MRNRVVGYALFVAFVGLGTWACSDDDDSGGGGGVKTVCGITCGGTATCTSSSGVMEGTASAQSDSCTLSASSGTAVLNCDGTATFDPSGDGTWTGGGTSVSFVDPGGTSWTCTITPPASSGTGGFGGGGTGGGGSGGSSGGDTGGTGGGTGGGSGDACSACLESMCGEEYAACASAGTPCGDLMACMQSCTDEACQNACLEQNPSGYEALMAFYQCLTDNCASACE